MPAEDPVSKLRADFIFSFTPYELQALKRTKKVALAGYPVCFASCEDVIIHKMVAARAVDEEDVKSILVKNKGSIDSEYIGRWLLEFSKLPEHKEILKKFSALLEE